MLLPCPCTTQGPTIRRYWLIWRACRCGGISQRGVANGTLFVGRKSGARVLLLLLLLLFLAALPLPLLFLPLLLFLTLVLSLLCRSEEFRLLPLFIVLKTSLPSPSHEF